jgi:hypothetical protein
MMRKISYFLLLIFVCVLLSGCHLLWKRYNTKNTQFSISVPRWWEVDDTKPPMALIVLSPSQGKKDMFRENLTVAVADLNNQDEKEIFWEVNRKLLPNAVMGYKSNFVEGEIFAGFLKGQTLTFDVENDNLKLRLKTVVFFNKLRVYVVTYSAEQKYWNKYSRVFDKILASFRYH